MFQLPKIQFLTRNHPNPNRALKHHIAKIIKNDGKIIKLSPNPRTIPYLENNSIGIEKICLAWRV